MPSSELESIAVLYDEYTDSPKGRIEVCEKMIKLGDPEAIPMLNFIYTEDIDEGVRKKAGEGLRHFRAMQQRLEQELVSSKGGQGSGRLKGFLTISLVLLILANIGAWYMKQMEGDKGDPEAEQRARLTKNISTTLDGVISDSLGLQTELRKWQSGASLPNCSRPYVRPSEIELSPDDQTKYAEFAPLVSDANFGVNGLDVVFGFWDTVCAGGQDLTDVSSNLGRLSSVLQVALQTHQNPLIDGEVGSRMELLGQVSVKLDEAISDAQVLQAELQKILANGSPSCSQAFKRPQKLVLSEAEAQRYPDIQTFIGNELDFSLDGLQSVLSFWDTVVCVGGVYQPSDTEANSQRLSTVIEAAQSARDNKLVTLINTQ